jgi:hypothetical protein
MCKVAKGLGNKWKLVPHLEKTIGQGDFEWNFDYTPKIKDDAWHPSGDCTPSLHALYLKATGQLDEAPLTATSYKTFMNGHFWHAYLQWIVQHKLKFADHQAIERRGHKLWAEPVASYSKHDLYFYREGRDVSDNLLRVWPDSDDRTAKVQPKPYHWATGSGDIAPCSIPVYGDYIVDFKTVNTRMFTYGPSDDVLAKWECQGNIYMDFFDGDRILFVGIQKDYPHDMKEWEFRRNQPLIDAIYKKWMLVSECLDEGIVPPEDEEFPLPLEGPIS